MVARQFGVARVSAPGCSPKIRGGSTPGSPQLTHYQELLDNGRSCRTLILDSYKANSSARRNLQEPNGSGLRARRLMTGRHAGLLGALLSGVLSAPFPHLPTHQ